MKERARKTERILAVQRQMHRIEAWRLEELKRTLAEIEEAKAGVLAALNSEDALHGLFIDQTARRLRSLSEQASRTSAEIEAQVAVVLDQGTKLKCAERLAEKVSDACDKDIERKDLLEVIERAVARGDASLP